ncbi:hypothetical protein ACFFV7_16300 [Nonomuraea spiralis]|uniref:FXSXX-COOH protein n=1 Tax=Nonomuraea spiralis TaxID=46182 RepID=A0ABV5IFR8_9ACTN|nr:hypothetical protein [Nonomuraea spiralis]GGS68144.1 hypothetical protein GCM10010176_008150 [Nonomuraea spiralis]
MGDDRGTELIDVSDVNLEDLKRLQNPALLRALQASGNGEGPVAGFTSVI